MDVLPNQFTAQLDTTIQNLKDDLKSDRKRFLEDQEAFRQVRQRLIARDAKMKRSSKVLGHLQLARKACVATDIPAASSRTVCKKCQKCPPKAGNYGFCSACRTGAANRPSQISSGDGTSESTSRAVPPTKLSQTSLSATPPCV